MRLLTAGSLVRVQLGEPKEYSLSTVGVDDAGGSPVPIPNTEVKPCSAEDTWLATARENRKMPTSDSEYFFIYNSIITLTAHLVKWAVTIYGVYYYTLTYRTLEKAGWSIR